MKRAFLLLVLLCLLPIHALAQFITVPDEIYEALLADELISSYGPMLRRRRNCFP